MTEGVHKWDGKICEGPKSQDNYSSEKKCYCVPLLRFVSRVCLSMKANANHVSSVSEATFLVKTIILISDNNKMRLESELKVHV